MCATIEPLVLSPLRGLTMLDASTRPGPYGPGYSSDGPTGLTATAPPHIRPCDKSCAVPAVIFALAVFVAFVIFVAFVVQPFCARHRSIRARVFSLPSNRRVSVSPGEMVRPVTATRMG